MDLIRIASRLAAAPLNDIKCPTCGEVCSSDEKSCWKCGGKLPVKPTTQTPSSSSSSSTINHSPKMESMLSGCKDPFSEADSTCSIGYDTDGLAIFDIFEKGFDLAQKASGKKVFFGEFEDIAVFVVAGSEDEACNIVDSWPKKP